VKIFLSVIFLFLSLSLKANENVYRNDKIIGEDGLLITRSGDTARIPLENRYWYKLSMMATFLFIDDLGAVNGPCALGTSQKSGEIDGIKVLHLKCFDYLGSTGNILKAVFVATKDRDLIEIGSCVKGKSVFPHLYKTIDHLCVKSKDFRYPSFYKERSSIGDKITVEECTSIVKKLKLMSGKWDLDC
jgi:hypothetical protein